MLALLFAPPPPFLFLFFVLLPPFLCAPLSLAFFGFRPRQPWALALCAPPPFFRFFYFFYFILPCGLLGSVFVSSRPPFPLSPPSPFFCFFLAFSAFSPRRACFVGLPLLGSFGRFFDVAAPSPAPGVRFAVVFAATRGSAFFLRCFAPAPLLGVHRRFSLPHPPPLCARCALCCPDARRCAALLSGVLRCRVAPFCPECRAVVPRLALFWVHVRCSLGREFGFLVCCLVGHCCVLRRVSGRVVLLHCFVVVGCPVLVCGAECCALQCPWVRCCTALLRFAPPGVVLFCAVLCCFARLVPLIAVLCPRALSVALGSSLLRRCVLWCSLALCALCCFCSAVVRWCVLSFAAVLCAVCGCCVCPGLSCCAFCVLFALCGAVLHCAGALAFCCLCGLRCLWCLVVCCVAVQCAVFCGVLWRRAGSGCPQLSSVWVSVPLSGRPASLPLAGLACCGALLPCDEFCDAVLSCGAVLSCSAVCLRCCLCLLFLLLCPVVLCCPVVPCCWAVLCVFLCCSCLSCFENVFQQKKIFLK